MHLNTKIDNYDLYDGKTSQEVMEKHDDNQRSWRFNLFGTKRSNNLKINPFEDTCIGIHVYPSNLHSYSLTLAQTSKYSSRPKYFIFSARFLNIASFYVNRR